MDDKALEAVAHEIAMTCARSGKTGRVHQMAYVAAKEGARAAIAAYEAEREPVAWHYRAFIGNRWREWEHINDIEAFRKKYASVLDGGQIELRPVYAAAPSPEQETRP